MRLLQRLSQSFDPTRPEQAQEYLNALRESWRDVSAGITRNAWIILLLLAGFELAGYRAISTVTLGPLVLENLKYVRIFVPTIVSYLFYEQILLVARWIESEATHRYLMHMLSPEIEECDFDALLAPRLPALSNLVHSYSKSSQTTSKAIRAVTQYLLAALILLSILAFDVVALRELGKEFGFTNILFLINVSLTSILVVLTLTVLGFWLAEERLVA